jgi:signal transduction histidine kinase/HAMP domain-containing protein/ActR/RegA family two-component response regulator
MTTGISSDSPEVAPESVTSESAASWASLRRVRFGIATRLTLVVIPLVLIPLGALAYAWYSSTRSAMELQVREELQVRLRQVALRLRPFLRERELDLYDLASSPALRDYHTQLDYKLIQEADVALKKLSEHFLHFLSRRDEVVAEARYLDQNGRELVSASTGGARRSGASYAKAPFFLRAKALPPDSGLATSVETSETLQVTVLRLALPVYNEWKEFRGVMAVDLPLSYFTATLAGALTGRTGTSFLADVNGTILGPPGAKEALVARWKGSKELAETLRALPGDPRIVDLEDGDRGLLVRTSVGAHGWSIGFLAPLAETEGPVRALTRTTLLYGSAGAIVLVLAVVLVALGASRRVRRLQSATAQLASGNFGLRMPAEGSDEVGELGRSFNLMAESLARRDAELGARTEEAQRRRQELEVLNAVIQAAHTSLDLRESLEAILDRLMALFNFTAGGIRLLDESREHLILVAHRGLRPSYAANPIPLRNDEGHSGQALRARQPLLLSDATDLAPYRERVPEGTTVGGVLLIPILSKGQGLGAIVLMAERRLDFTFAALHLLASIGLEVGTAIQNARLFSQTQALLSEAERHRARAEALAEIGRSVTATLDLDRVLDLVVERVSEAMRADAVSILRREGDTLHYLRAQGLSPDRESTVSLRARDEFTGDAELMRAPLWTPDLSTDARFIENSHALALFKTQGIRAVLAAPVILGEDVWGILGIGIRNQYTFSPEEVRFAGAVAQQAAIAIGNAKLYADLRSAYAQLEAAQEQAVQTAKLGALGQMAGGVAHDFNNLLAAILGRAELLQRRTSDPLVVQGLKVIQGAALDGAETVRRILGFARAKGEEQVESVDIAPLLQQVVEIARPRWKDEAQARGALINVMLALEAAPPVRGNAAELREVFLNLLLNAVDAMPGGGTLTLGVRTLKRVDDNGDHGTPAVECFVRDTGVGMSAEVRRRAFDPFFTTKGARGTGLGLSVVYGIVSRHGGRVRIDSRENAGTTVTVNLPVFTGLPSAPAPEPVTAEVASARILVVDDEEVLAQMLADILRLEAGHIVEVMTDARAALDRLTTDPPDLLFTDLGMPVLSGWELAAQAHALHPGLPVVLVTGWGHQLDPDRVRAAGVVGVVAKPYRIEDIRKAVAGALAGVLQDT